MGGVPVIHHEPTRVRGAALTIAVRRGDGLTLGVAATAKLPRKEAAGSSPAETARCALPPGGAPALRIGGRWSPCWPAGRSRRRSGRSCRSLQSLQRSVAATYGHFQWRTSSVSHLMQSTGQGSRLGLAPLRASIRSPCASTGGGSVPGGASLDARCSRCIGLADVISPARFPRRRRAARAQVDGLGEGADDSFRPPGGRLLILSWRRWPRRGASLVTAGHFGRRQQGVDLLGDASLVAGTATPARAAHRPEQIGNSDRQEHASSCKPDQPAKTRERLDIRPAVIMPISRRRLGGADASAEMACAQRRATVTQCTRKSPAQRPKPWMSGRRRPCSIAWR